LVCDEPIADVESQGSMYEAHYQRHSGFSTGQGERLRGGGLKIFTTAL